MTTSADTYRDALHSDLADVITPQHTPCLSVLMPIHPGAGGRVDRIVFKNLLTEAHNRLLARDTRPAEADKFLKAVRSAVNDFNVPTGTQGLAVYADSAEIRVVPLTFSVGPLITFADHFQIKPLFSLPQLAQDFFILALSAKRTRLIRCAQTGATEVEVPDLPESLASIRPGVEPQKQLQYRSMPQGGALFHGHGAAKDGDRSRPAQYVRLIERAVAKHLGTAGPPLVLAGVSDIVHAYRQMATEGQLLAEAVPGNPDDTSEAELRRLAAPLVEHALAAQERGDIERCASLLSTRHARVVSEIGRVLSAAHDGNVETLFVAGDVERWGAWDPSNVRGVQVEPEGPDDLLNVATMLTVQSRGTVRVVPANQMPLGESIAAILRY